MPGVSFAPRVGEKISYSHPPDVDSPGANFWGNFLTRNFLCSTLRGCPPGLCIFMSSCSYICCTQVVQERHTDSEDPFSGEFKIKSELTRRRIRRASRTARRARSAGNIVQGLGNFRASQIQAGLRKVTKYILLISVN